MKVFLVGGAIRDNLLNKPIKDRDWVVVGSSPEEMLRKGFKQVGYDFPVFIHPKTGEEYALARTERKVSRGHTGFICCSSMTITIEDDLQRRDLTINAIAQDETGKYYDPHYGLNDLRLKLLRHISPSFVDDPLRVLRVARFAAEYAYLGFQIAEETINLMKQMVINGELNSLTPERIWKETELALCSNNPEIYFQSLRNCKALSIIFPEIDQLFRCKIINPKMGTNIGLYTMQALNSIVQLSADISVRFATICINLGQGLLAKKNDENIKKFNINLIRLFCDRLRVPNNIRNLAILAISIRELIFNINQQSPIKLVSLLNYIDSWRRPDRIKQLSLIIRANTHIFKKNKKQLHQDLYLKAIWKIASTVKITDLSPKIKNDKIKIELNKLRIAKIKSWQNKLRKHTDS